MRIRGPHSRRSCDAVTLERAKPQAAAALNRRMPKLEADQPAVLKIVFGIILRHVHYLQQRQCSALGDDLVAEDFDPCGGR